MPQDKIKFPFGAADFQLIAYAAAITVTVVNALTIVKVVTMTGNLTLNVTTDSQVPVGSELIVELQSDATARDTTFGTGIDGPILTGTISKTKSQAFYLSADGVFKPKGASAQVD